MKNKSGITESTVFVTMVLAIITLTCIILSQCSPAYA